MTRLLTITLLSVLLATSLSACGRKGAPEFPPGSTYPIEYPNHK